jgi:hypothetical protein
MEVRHLENRHDDQEQGRGAGYLIPRYPVFSSNQRREVDYSTSNTKLIPVISTPSAYISDRKFLTYASTAANRTFMAAISASDAGLGTATSPGPNIPVLPGGIVQ